MLSFLTLTTFNSVFSQVRNTGSTKPFIDTSVDNIVLLEDLTPILGGLESEFEFEDCDPNCRKIYYNLDSTEILELFFYPGRIKGQCSSFMISQNNNQIEKPNNISVLPVKRFISGKGIKLFATFSSIITLFDSLKINIQRTDTSEIITYLGSQQNTNSQLKKYEIDLYRSRYIFKNKKLVSFEFGFDYP